MDKAYLLDKKMADFDWLDMLDDEGIEALIVTNEEDMEPITSDSMPHLAIIDFASMTDSDARNCIEQCSEMNLPTIALVPRERMLEVDVTLKVNDFVASPPDSAEIFMRVKHILWQTRSQGGDDVIRAADLVINPSTYEVSLNGKRVNLRFKEYELLRLLVTNPGRVYTREALLSRIWGYDYFGGTRTVDVHVRRLRSKIEDADHSFIETIWNVGYRFRDMREGQ